MELLNFMAYTANPVLKLGAVLGDYNIKIKAWLILSLKYWGFTISSWLFVIFKIKDCLLKY